MFMSVTQAFLMVQETFLNSLIASIRCCRKCNNYINLVQDNDILAFSSFFIMKVIFLSVFPNLLHSG